MCVYVYVCVCMCVYVETRSPHLGEASLAPAPLHHAPLMVYLDVYPVIFHSIYVYLSAGDIVVQLTFYVSLFVCYSSPFIFHCFYSSHGSYMGLP